MSERTSAEDQHLATVSPAPPKSTPKAKQGARPTQRRLSLSKTLQEANKNANVAFVTNPTEARRVSVSSTPTSSALSKSNSSALSPRTKKVELPPASRANASGIEQAVPPTREDEDATEDNKSSGSEDEAARSKSFNETMSLARNTNRRSTVIAAKLIESVTFRWSHYTEKMVVQLIENAADVNSYLEEPWDRGFDGYVQTLGATTLHFAARRGLLEVCQALLDYRADPNASTNLGISPIMVAVMFDQVEAIKLLFGAKASVLQQDQGGLCAVDFAVLEGSHDVLQVINHCEEEEERIREERVAKEFEELRQDFDDEDDNDFLGSETFSWLNALDNEQQPPQISRNKTEHVGGNDASNFHRSLAPRMQARADAFTGRKGLLRSKTSALVTGRRGTRISVESDFSDSKYSLDTPTGGNGSREGSLSPDNRSACASPLPEEESEEQDSPFASTVTSRVSTFALEQQLPLISPQVSQSEAQPEVVGRKSRRFGILSP